MLATVNVVAPVFGLIAIGYLSVRYRLYPAAGVKGLIAFVNNFCTPCLLFQSMLNADFSTAFNPAILVPFYIGSFFSLLIGSLIAFRLFGNRPGESICSGFAACFTNSVLVGFPLIQRAYGDDAMPVIFSIIGLHAPLLITAATIAIELVRRDARPMSEVARTILVRVVQNPLLWGIALGLSFNFAGVHLAEPLTAGVAMLAGAVMPAALFGLGGALNEYRLADNWGQALAMSGLKLIIHPTIAWLLMVPLLGVDPHIARYAVLLAAMPTGINAYVFATFYNRGVSVSANTVLLTTVLSMFTISFWLLMLGH
jgi:malonate transporter